MKAPIDGRATAPAVSPSPPSHRSPSHPPPPVSRSKERLVLAANRIFHDLVAARYDTAHAEVFVAERARWQCAAGTWLAGDPRPLEILDIGTGTGFVPSVIAPFLSLEDRVTCTDLSEVMLEAARSRLEGIESLCRFEFELVDGVEYPFPSKSFDVITANSAIRHVPDLQKLFAEIDRLLRAGGLLCIGHEPNGKHDRIPALDRLRRHGSPLDPRRGVLEAPSREIEETLDAVAAALTAEGLLPEPPSRAEVIAWIDFHSPTSGVANDPRRGIEIDRIREAWLPSYALVEFETFHSRNVRANDARWRPLDDRTHRMLAKRFPGAGATFFATLRKPPAPRRD